MVQSKQLVIFLCNVKFVLFNIDHCLLKMGIRVHRILGLAKLTVLVIYDIKAFIYKNKCFYSLNVTPK